MDLRAAGPFVAIEGISGSGKSTLARLLTAGLAGSGEPVHTIPQPMTSLTAYLNTNAAALPQLAFYLAGVLHASDLIRERLCVGPCVADRYVNSVVANHAGVHDIGLADVLAMAEPLTSYLVRPDLTVYLQTGADELSRRLSSKPDVSPSDKQLLADPELVTRIRQLYDELAADDPSAVRLVTDGRSPDSLAAEVIARIRERHAA